MRYTVEQQPDNTEAAGPLFWWLLIISSVGNTDTGVILGLAELRASEGVEQRPLI